MRGPTIQSQLPRCRSPSKLDDLKRVEGRRKSGRAGGAGLRVVGRPVEEIRQAMRAAERVIDLHAEFVRRLRPSSRRERGSCSTT